MKRKKSKNYANCPCCKTGRHQSEMQKMVNFLVKEFPNQNKTFELIKSEVFEFLKNNQFAWACDICLDKGLAIFAKTSMQKPSYSSCFIYFDTENECQNCKKYFLFYAKEKQFWYESLKFSIDSVPINCVSCRKTVRNKKNENTRLSNILINGEENLTKEDLQELIAIYTKCEKVERRKYFENKLSKPKNTNPSMFSVRYFLSVKFE